MKTSYISKADIFQWVVRKPIEIAEQILKISRDDPRKQIHSFKVGLALIIVSMIYYIQPLYKNFGDYAVWPIITVVVVSEFTVGETLEKGLNLVLATLVAGALGVGAHYLAILTGETSEPLLIALFLFLLAVVSTFIRFFPKVKARYDYGMMVFILTFCLVSISGYQTDEVVILAQQRLLTILIGTSISVIVSIFIFPVWAGEDLHNLTAQHLDELGRLMEVFAECFRIPEQAETGSVRLSIFTLNDLLVDSKTKEETLANFAKWEPGHGRFVYGHPWKHYLEIGDLARQCVFWVQAINGFSYFLTQQGQQEIKLQGVIQEALSSMGDQSGKLLRELSLAITTVTKPSSIIPHKTKLNTLTKNMLTRLKSVTSLENHYTNVFQITPFAAVAAFLIETVTCVEFITDTVDKLGVVAKVKCMEKRGFVGEMANANTKNAQATGMSDVPCVSITIEENVMSPVPKTSHYILKGSGCDISEETSPRLPILSP